MQQQIKWFIYSLILLSVFALMSFKTGLVLYERVSLEREREKEVTTKMQIKQCNKGAYLDIKSNRPGPTQK